MTCDTQAITTAASSDSQGAHLETLAKALVSGTVSLLKGDSYFMFFMLVKL